MDLSTGHYQDPPKPTDKSELRQMLTAPSSCALSLLVATEAIFDGAFIWEPETLWLTFDRMGIDVPLVNRAKIQAGVTVMFMPAFYWDAIVFEKTALAFSDVLPNPEALQEATPAQLSWAVAEVQRIADKMTLQKQPWETEPKVYAATVLHRAGYILAPEQLAFAQEQLDMLNVEQADLRTRVTERLAQIETIDVHDHTFEETAEGVQLGYLSAVKHYVAEKTSQLAAELKRLGH